MARIPRAAAVTIAAACAVTLSVPLAAADDAARSHGHFSPGAPGIGDPYYPLAGNGGYDVRHYDIAGRYDPATDVWSATTKISAKATQNLSQFDLDFVGSDVRGVVVNGRPAHWSRTETELVLVPKRKIKRGDPIDVTVVYSGVPREFLLPLEGIELRTGFMATDDGATVAGQPDVAAGWFPVNDHPLDKASYRFTVTVPDGLGVVANGVLRSQWTKRGWTTFTWDARDPMASYLATIDIGTWDIRQWKTSSGLPVYDAVDPDLVSDPVLGPAIDSSLARQGEVLDVLGARFGAYPFGTVGAIVDDQPDLFFALETQTRPVYSKYFWPDDGDSVVAHELAHQWFGDDVALGRWQDIWLNEGFATYAEWIWAEHEGFFTPQDVFDAVMGPDGIPVDDPFWAVPIGQPAPADLFAGPVYLRGGLTLQALRQEVGDATFWRILRTWAARRSGGNATTSEFIAHAERVSGRQLDDFFNTWLFTAGKPAATATSAAAMTKSLVPSNASSRSAVATWLEQAESRLERGRY